MDRRQFLRRAGAMGAALGLAPGFWQQALSAPAEPGPSPYGPLLPPDANGLMLPEGFTSRVVAASLAPVAATGHLWHLFPDGGACVPTDDGGWIYVSNSENPPPIDIPGVTAVLAQLGRTIPGLPTHGGVGAIRFAADGTVVDAYTILAGSQSNCAGGMTDWGTWLSCEEWEDTQAYDAGLVWECDPYGVRPAVARPALGRFKHEMAASDPVRECLYLSEDQPDGLVYRYTPPAGSWGSGDALEGGLLEAMVVGDGGAVSWLSVGDFEDPAAPTRPLRHAVVGATPFNGGEGILCDGDLVYLTTKGDDRVWLYDIDGGTMTVLYEASEHIQPVLDGVDNIAVSANHDLYVAEDGGNLEVCVITPERSVFPLVRMTGGQHGIETGTPIPLISEVTGLALSPDGNRLYFSSERGMGIGGLPIGPGPGILYEVTGPFRGGTLEAAAAEGLAARGGSRAPAPAAVASTAPVAGAPVARPAAGSAAPAGELPATGAGLPMGAAAAAGLWQLRRRTEPDHR